MLNKYEIGFPIEFPKGHEMEIADLPILLRHRTDAADCERWHLDRLGYQCHDPVRESEVRVAGRFLASVSCALGQIAGVAVVYPTGASTAFGYGRESCLQRWGAVVRELVLLYRRSRRHDLLVALGRAARHQVPRHVLATRDARLALQDVLHAVVNRHPGLRVWRPSLPGEPEVLVRWQADNLHLGGSPRGWEHYQGVDYIWEK